MKITADPSCINNCSNSRNVYQEIGIFIQVPITSWDIQSRVGEKVHCKNGCYIKYDLHINFCPVCGEKVEPLKNSIHWKTLGNIPQDIVDFVNANDFDIMELGEEYNIEDSDTYNICVQRYRSISVYNTGFHTLYTNMILSDIASVRIKYSEFIEKNNASVVFGLGSFFGE